MSVTKKPMVLVILDGYGYREDQQDNAIYSAKTPVMDALWAKCPHTLIDASGLEVGLPDRQMGNSEVIRTSPRFRFRTSWPWPPLCCRKKYSSKGSALRKRPAAS